MWGNAFKQNPTEGLDPRDFGWQLVEGNFVAKWFEGPQLPSSDLLNTVEPEVDLNLSDGSSSCTLYDDDDLSDNSLWSSDSEEDEVE